MPRPWPVATAGWESRVLSPWRESRRRRAAWFALIAGVLLAHLLFGARVLASVIGWNTAPQPRRIEITFSQQLQPTAAAEPPRPPRARRPPGPASRACGARRARELRARDCA